MEQDKGRMEMRKLSGSRQACGREYNRRKVKEFTSINSAILHSCLDLITFLADSLTGPKLSVLVVF